MNLRDKLRRWSDKLDHVAQEAGFIQTGKLLDRDIGSPSARRGVYSDPDMAHRMIGMVPGKRIPPAVENGSSAVAAIPASGFQEAARDTIEPEGATLLADGEIRVAATDQLNSQAPRLFNTLLGDAGRQSEPRQAIISVHGEDVKEDQLDSNAA